MRKNQMKSTSIKIEPVGDIIYDSESDGFVEEATRIWVISCFDRGCNKVRIFHNFPDVYRRTGSIKQGLMFLRDAMRKGNNIICHNQIGHDLPLFQKIEPRFTYTRENIVDSLIMSRAIWFDRPIPKTCKGGTHSLEAWGLRNKFPKPEHEEWHRFSADMVKRCIMDTLNNNMTYNKLLEESKGWARYERVMKREHEVAFEVQQQARNGWLADTDKMKEHVETLDKLMEEIREQVEPNIPPHPSPYDATKCHWDEVNEMLGMPWRKVPGRKRDHLGNPIRPAGKPVGGVKMVPKTKRKKVELDEPHPETGKDYEWITEEVLDDDGQPIMVESGGLYAKSGGYKSNIAKYFEIDPESAKDPDGGLIGGPFTKVQFTKVTLSQHARIKDYLLKYCGWIPDEWNYKKNSYGKFIRDNKRRLVKSSPKLTETSYDTIEGGLGQMIGRFYTYHHRRNTILNIKGSKSKGWLNQIREDGRLSAGANTFGTSTGRQSQYGIVNVPSVTALFGGEMRECWIAPAGRMIVGCDISSAQLRLLANYMKDPIYTHAVCEGMEYEVSPKTFELKSEPTYEDDYEIHYDDEPNKCKYDKKEDTWLIYRGTDPHSLNSIACGLSNEYDSLKQLAKGRKLAKNFIYGFLFGAQAPKIASIIGCSIPEAEQVIENYFLKFPSLQTLKDDLLQEWNESKLYWMKKGFKNRACITVLGDTKLHCETDRKLLNYLLMGSEAQLMKQAIINTNTEIRNRGLDALMVANIHDEYSFDTLEDDVEAMLELTPRAITMAGEQLGAEVRMDGDAKSGINWRVVH